MITASVTKELNFKVALKHESYSNICRRLRVIFTLYFLLFILVYIYPSKRVEFSKRRPIIPKGFSSHTLRVWIGGDLSLFPPNPAWSKKMKAHIFQVLHFSIYLEGVNARLNSLVYFMDITCLRVSFSWNVSFKFERYFIETERNIHSKYRYSLLCGSNSFR